MRDIIFRLSLTDLEEARQEHYIQGLVQGEKNIETLRRTENKAAAQTATNLRLLAEKYGAPQDEIDDCWPKGYGKIYEKSAQSVDRSEDKA